MTEFVLGLNMRKNIFAIFMWIFVAFVLTGCKQIPEAEGYKEDIGRFAIAISEGANSIYVDTETGVMYFFSKVWKRRWNDCYVGRRW